LPANGGTDDQEAGLLSKLGYLEAVYNSFSSMKHTRQNMKDWSDTHSQMWGIVGRTEKLKRDLIEAAEKEAAEELENGR